MNKMIDKRLPITEKRGFCVCNVDQVNWSATCAAEDSLDVCANLPIHFAKPKRRPMLGDRVIDLSRPLEAAYKVMTVGSITFAAFNGERYMERYYDQCDVSWGFVDEELASELVVKAQVEAEPLQAAFALITKNVKDLEMFIDGLDTALVDASVDGRTKLTMPVTKAAEKIILQLQKELSQKSHRAAQG
jgi:hypothetical protein